MADDPQPNTPPNDQNPLDVLEQLLQKAKDKKAQNDTSNSAPASVSTEPTPEQLEAAEMAARQADFEEKQAKQILLDKAKIKEQLQGIRDLKNTPQYQARVVQEEEKKKDEATKIDLQDGYEIEQLKHTKI